MKALIIIVLVVAALIGLLMTLRSSRNTGIPSADVLERARKRAEEQAKKEED
jgi:hypothetical protein